jgi:hypothetical protein
MQSLARGVREPSLTALALAIVASVLSCSTAWADGDALKNSDSVASQHGLADDQISLGSGAWNNSGYGVYPGDYGFGLSFHLGYGYGGNALGVGVNGGYPYYGGPGYPHPAPHLRRCHKEEPFSFYGGLGFPFAFRGPGQLVVNQDVVTEGNPLETGAAGSAPIEFPQPANYGAFTGALPYPEGFFSPFTTAAARGRSAASRPAYSAAATGSAPTGREFGIDEELVVNTDGTLGVKVLQVYPKSAAEAAGLQPGDIIRSANGYQTERPGNLAWIMANAARDNTLTMNVRKQSDGKVHTLTARIPVKPSNAPPPSEVPPLEGSLPPAR